MTPLSDKLGLVDVPITEGQPLLPHCRPDPAGLSGDDPYPLGFYSYTPTWYLLTYYQGKLMSQTKAPQFLNAIKRTKIIAEHTPGAASYDFVITQEPK